MTDQYETKARNIMDEACLPKWYYDNGVYSACVSAISSALHEAVEEERREIMNLLGYDENSDEGTRILAVLEPFAEWARLTKMTHPTMVPEDHILEAEFESGPAVYVVHWEAFLDAWRIYRTSKGTRNA